VLATATVSGLAIAKEAPKPSYTENGFSSGLLDASTPRAERMKLFAHMIALANSGQVRAQDLAGTLYWQGSNITGSPVPVNLGQARKLLANAAVSGDRVAMAKLAELELAAGRPTPAMVWAQMYARYLDPQRGPRAAKLDGYAAKLINRIIKAGGKANPAVRTSVAKLVSSYDDRIRHGIDTLRHQEDHGRTFMVQKPGATHREPRNILNLGGVAEYMVEFDTHGKPTHIWTLDAFPHPELGQELHYYLTNVLANDAPDGSGMRYLRVSITHQPHKFRLLRLTH
jgi:hypothetical protein